MTVVWILAYIIVSITKWARLWKAYALSSQANLNWSCGLFAVLQWQDTNEMDHVLLSIPLVCLFDHRFYQTSKWRTWNCSSRKSRLLENLIDLVKTQQNSTGFMFKRNDPNWIQFVKPSYFRILLVVKTFNGEKSLLLTLPHSSLGPRWYS